MAARSLLSVPPSEQSVWVAYLNTRKCRVVSSTAAKNFTLTLLKTSFVLTPAQLRSGSADTFHLVLERKGQPYLWALKQLQLLRFGSVQGVQAMRLRGGNEDKQGAVVKITSNDAVTSA